MYLLLESISLILIIIQIRQYKLEIKFDCF
jgi:hypothetical protein